MFEVSPQLTVHRLLLLVNLCRYFESRIVWQLLGKFKRYRWLLLTWPQWSCEKSWHKGIMYLPTSTSSVPFFPDYVMDQYFSLIAQIFLLHFLLTRPSQRNWPLCPWVSIVKHIFNLVNLCYICECLITTHSFLAIYMLLICIKLIIPGKIF